MSKAMPQDVIDLGFSAQQFGVDAATFAVEDAGYLAKILNRVALEVENEVGADLYAEASDADDATTPQKLNHARLADAETNLVAAELYRRLEAFERRGKTHGREDSSAETIGSRLLANAAAAEARAWAAIERITGSAREGGLSVTYVESGQFDSAVP